MIEQYTAAVYEAPDRLFQIMRTSRTRTQLWLQADASPSSGIPLRLEVHFDSVQYLCLPFVIRGLTLRAATTTERQRLSAAHGLDLAESQGVYLLSEKQDWFIVSSPPQWAEAHLSYNDGPVFWDHAGNEDVVASMGTLA